MKLLKNSFIFYKKKYYGFESSLIEFEKKFF